MKNRFHPSACAQAAALCVALTCLTPLHAQSDSPASTSQISKLEDITVTATRTPSRSDAVVSDVRSFSREEIESARGESVAEFLQRRANIQLASSGGFGQTTSLFVRGTNSSHVLLLVDGLRLGSITSGSPSWHGLSLESIERIEVLKGPASSLYGSDAVGGVVQIFTRRDVKGVKPSLAMTVSDKSQGALDFNLAAGGQAGSLNLGFAQKRDNTLSATNNKASSFVYDPDIDDSEQQSLRINGLARLTPNWSIGAALLDTTTEGFFDKGSYDLGQTAISAYVDGQVTQNWRSKLTMGRTEDNYTSTFGTTNGTQSQTVWQNNVQLPVVGMLIAGLEQTRQSVESGTDYAVTDRKMDSAFAGLQGAYQALNWQLNVRRDKNSQYGRVNTGSAGVGYKISPQLRAKASYGTSFKAPSFNDLYYPWGSGNPDLLPERGKNKELGLEWVSGAHEVSAQIFDNRIRDLIALDSNYVPQNTAQARIRGWSLDYRTQFGALALRAGLERLDPKDEASGKLLARRAKTAANVGLDYEAANWSAGVAAQYQGKRFDDAANSETKALSAYTLWHLHAKYKLNAAWSVLAKLHNATDKQYETVYGYNQPGRTFTLTLQFKPE